MAGHDTTPAEPAVALTAIVVDAAGHHVILAALDLYQRVAMGQWSDLPDHAPNIGFHLTRHEVGAELTRLRARHTATPAALQHPSASLGIAAAGDNARLAYDLWHALGGGMPERRNDRLAHGHTIQVTPATATSRPAGDDNGF